MSYTAVSIVLTVVAAAFYGSIVLYGAWIDGRRQAVRDKGLHPVTEPTGAVHAREQETHDGSDRN